MVGLTFFKNKHNVQCDLHLSPSFSDCRSFFPIVLLNFSSVFIPFSFLSNHVHILGPKNLIKCLPRYRVVAWDSKVRITNLKSILGLFFVE